MTNQDKVDKMQAMMVQAVLTCCKGRASQGPHAGAGPDHACQLDEHAPEVCTLCQVKLHALLALR